MTDTMESEPMMMSLVEAARRLKCSQNKLREFQKQGLLKKVRGVRLKERGIVPHLIDFNEAKRLIVDYRSSKRRMEKILHVVMPDTTYARIEALSVKTGYPLSRIGRMIVEDGLVEIEKKLSNEEVS